MTNKVHLKKIFLFNSTARLNNCHHTCVQTSYALSNVWLQGQTKQNLAKNQHPDFEWKQRHQVIFKNPENHALACLLNLQIFALLIRFVIFFIWSGFRPLSYILSFLNFLNTRHMSSGIACGNFSQRVLSKNSRILEGAHAHHMDMLIEVQCHAVEQCT